MQWGRSALKICGSAKKIRSGSDILTKLSREKRFLLKPSRFQVKEVMLRVVAGPLVGGPVEIKLGIVAPTL